MLDIPKKVLRISLACKTTYFNAKELRLAFFWPYKNRWASLLSLLIQAILYIYKEAKQNLVHQAVYG